MSFSRWPAPGILALYHLEDVNDSSGNSHTLTNNGTVTFGAGKFGNCALLGSANSSKFLSHADAFAEDLSGTASVSAWIYIETLPASGESQFVWTWESTTGTARYIYMSYYNDSGTKKLRLNCSGNILDYSIDLSVNTWYKIDVNIDSTCEIFLNGASVGTSARGTTTATHNLISIGAYNPASPNYYFKGNIDEVVFFNAARSVADIRRCYAFERGRLV